jgi:hypothetical protein
VGAQWASWVSLTSTDRREAPAEGHLEIASWLDVTADAFDVEVQ